MNNVTPFRILMASALLCGLCYAPMSNAQISEVTEVLRSGDTETALSMLDQLRVTYPDDVDYMLLRAQIYARQGSNERALDELRIATAIAPDYEDLWRLRYSLLSRAVDDRDETERDVVLQQVQSRFPDSEWWQLIEDDRAPQWTVLIGAGHDRLDNGTPSWNRQFLELSREIESSGRQWLGVSRDARFSAADVAILGGANFGFADNWLIGFDYSTASNSAFLPDSAFGAQLGRTFDHGWGVTLRYRHRIFSTVSVDSTTVTTERYAGAFRFAYSLTATHLGGAGNSFGHSFTSNWYYNEQASVGLSISGGTEAEAIGPGRVLESQVRGIALTGRRELNERLGLQWWLGLHEQGDFYRRQFLGMAISIKL